MKDIINLRFGLSRFFLHQFSPEVETDGYYYFLYVEMRDNFVLFVRYNPVSGEMLYTNAGVDNASNDVVFKWNLRKTYHYSSIKDI